jgi:dephospho-CoA kinase
MPLTNRPFLFAVTGGIASGKTLFTQMLKALGLPIIDTDQIAHDVIETPSVRKLLLVRWGNKIVKEDKVDREAIASIVFNNPDELKVLNQLLHPIIIREMQRSVEQCLKTQLGFEVPLLFETGFHKYFDLNIMVTAPTEIRIQRLIDRGLDWEKASRRIASQMAESDKSELADVVIKNDMDIKSLEREAIKVYNLIKHGEKKEIISFNDFVNTI